MRITPTPQRRGLTPAEEVQAFGATACVLLIAGLVGFAALGGLDPFLMHPLARARQARLHPVTLAALPRTEPAVAEPSLARRVAGLAEDVGTPVSALDPAPAVASPVVLAAAPAPAPVPAEPAPVTPAPPAVTVPDPVDAPAQPAPATPPPATPTAPTIIPAGETGGGAVPDDPRSEDKDKDKDTDEDKGKDETAPSPPGNANGLTKVAAGKGPSADTPAGDPPGKAEGR